MPARLKYRTCDQVPPEWVDVALVLLRDFWQGRALRALEGLRRFPFHHAVDLDDCYSTLRLAALLAACRPSSSYPRRLRRLIWEDLGFALAKELGRSWWWVDQLDRGRLREVLRGTEPMPTGLLAPRSLHEVTEAVPSWLTHLADDVPDREALPLFEIAHQHLRAQQVHALLARLPRRYRGPTWRVHALGEDVFTAGKALGLGMRECHMLSTEGLARLRGLVARHPESLLPLD